MQAQSEYPEDDWLALSGLQHFAFCRRQWALIHVEQQWRDNYLTTAGSLNMTGLTTMARRKPGAIC